MKHLSNTDQFFLLKSRFHTTTDIPPLPSSYCSDICLRVGSIKGNSECRIQDEIATALLTLVPLDLLRVANRSILSAFTSIRVASMGVKITHQCHTHECSYQDTLLLNSFQYMCSRLE
jgi:hypothetical protein